MESVISIVASAVFIAVISVVVGGTITTATVIIIGAVATIMRGRNVCGMKSARWMMAVECCVQR